ncbi:MAG: aminoglycoside phosphotransferase family protein [Nonomuraea sp.]|nr:aminoglycoside phosphotransferase family protein [Nonomuraea sp.]
MIGATSPETLAWVEKHLPDGDRIDRVERLRGGWTSEMRRLHITGGRSLVLRSFVKPFYRRHAEGLLTREADILTLLQNTDIPAATLHAVDATAEHCAHPSLLMSLLPGTVRLADEHPDQLAEHLVKIHQLPVTDETRPRTYQPWTSPERVNVPEDTALWRRAVDVLRQDPPDYTGCFLHRDFHPGNVLFDGDRITGIVDWVETSWGPADLDVAHCSTTLALLHGVDAGMSFADRYVTAGGRLTNDVYWRILDALAFAPDAQKVAEPWRELGRTDLTPAVLTTRLENYLQALLDG